MGDWSSYSLSDFLLFSPQVYERMFALINEDLWPLQIVVLAVAVLVFGHVVRGGPASGRVLLVTLGAAWITVSVSFFLGRYQEINWLGAYIAPFAVSEGVLLLLIAFMSRVDLIQAGQNRAIFLSGAAMLATGLIIYPLLALAQGYPFVAAQVFAVAPDPTAIATLAGLSLLTSRVRLLAAIIPAIWGVFTVLTLSTLEVTDVYWVAGMFAIAFLAVAWARRPGVAGR